MYYSYLYEQKLPFFPPTDIRKKCKWSHLEINLKKQKLNNHFAIKNKTLLHLNKLECRGKVHLFQ